MAQFQWTFDAPTGVYKSHEMSSELRKAAIAQTKFMQFVKPEPGYGKNKGESITITRVSNLVVPSNGELIENIKIPEDTLTITTVAITVVEWGRSVPYTSLAEDLSAYNMENIVQRALRDQMKLVLDNAGAAAFRSSSSKIKATPTGIASIVFSTTGSPAAVGAANLDVYHIEQIRDYMFSTLYVPPFEGDDYVCLVSTKGKRGLLQDPAWETWHKYTDPESKYNGEIGRLENIRFVEINNTGALSGSLGTGGVQGEAIFFGLDAVAMAVALDPELRAAIPGDFGRSRAVAWYGILQFGVVWDTANPGEARIVHFTSQ
jgi:N4-gp56 family major capsid protein